MSNLPPKPCTSSFRHWNYPSTLSILRENVPNPLSQQNTAWQFLYITIDVDHFTINSSNFHLKNTHQRSAAGYQTLKFHHYYLSTIHYQLTCFFHCYWQSYRRPYCLSVHFYPSRSTWLLASCPNVSEFLGRIVDTRGQHTWGRLRAPTSQRKGFLCVLCSSRLDGWASWLTSAVQPQNDSVHLTETKREWRTDGGNALLPLQDRISTMESAERSEREEDVPSLSTN